MSEYIDYAQQTGHNFKKIVKSIMLTYVSFAIPVRVNSNGIYFYFQERSESGALGGFLEFPGGKIEEGETPVEACSRELREEWSIALSIDKFKRFSIDQFVYKDRKVQLHSFIIDVEENQIEVGQKVEAFISFDSYERDIKKLNMLEANFKILEKYINFMIGQINE